MSNGNLTRSMRRAEAEALGQRLTTPASGYTLDSGSPGLTACQYAGSKPGVKVIIYWTAKPKAQVSVVVQGAEAARKAFAAAYFGEAAAPASPNAAAGLQLVEASPKPAQMAAPATVRVGGPAPRGPMPTTEAGSATLPTDETSNLIGEGGMGRVTREALPDGTQVAVKRVRNDLLEAPELVKRFDREITAMLRLSDTGHPNVVPILRHGEYPLPWFAMPLAGQNLEKGLMEIHASLRDIIRTSLQILAGIELAHQHGIFHRDLKLSNVLLYPAHDGYIAKVSDFGLCQMTDADSLTRSGLAGAGSELYSAPELRKDLNKADHRADIFSFGVVLFGLLTGAPPTIPVRDYLDNKRSQRETKNLTESGRELIRACVDPDPSERPASIAQLRDRLWNAAEELCQHPSGLDAGHRLALAFEFALPFVRDSRADADCDALFTEFELVESEWHVRKFSALHWDDLMKLLRRDPERFAQQVVRFGAAVKEQWLPFSYVDKLGSFLQRLVKSDTSRRVLPVGLGQMLNLAYRHKRYEVADQVQQVLEGLRKDAVEDCKACFQRHKTETKWFLDGDRNRRAELRSHPISGALPQFGR